MTLHLTRKNAWIWLTGVCLVFVAAIGVLVPSEQWGLPLWKWIIFALVLFAIVGITLTFFSQSKEDRERESKEEEQDKTQQAIMSQLAQLSAKGSDKSTMLTTATAEMQPTNPPVEFDAQKVFNTAYHSLWTGDVEQRVKIAAAQNRAHYAPEDFYAKLIGVGLVAHLHDITWAYIWKSQFLMLAGSGAV